MLKFTCIRNIKDFYKIRDKWDHFISDNFPLSYCFNSYWLTAWWESYEKDKDTQIVTQIYLFPMIRLNCKSKKGSSFEVYSIGSETKFMIFSNF